MRSLSLLPLLLAAACASPGPRPVPRRAAPDRAELPAQEARVGWSPSASPALLESTGLETTVLGTVEQRSAAAPSGASSAPLALELSAVLDAVQSHSPLVLAALEEQARAAAELLGAQGGFDLRLKGKGGFTAEGTYPSERAQLGLEQPLRLGGASLLGGYRIGSGTFADYDDGARTNTGGELSAGVSIPLLQGRRVDARRVAEWRALLEVERASPLVAQKRLELALKATEAYWKWVAAGRKRALAESLLELAERRRDQVDAAVAEGQLAPIAATDNQRSIVDRTAKRIASERELERAAVELSLFWRGPDGAPRVPSPDALPADFPDPGDPAQVLLADDEARALSERPDLRERRLALRQGELEVELAENATLPDLDLQLLASQDLGAPTDPKDSLGPFQWKAGVSLSVPLQRRSAQGKLDALEAKLRKGRRELQFAQERAAAEVRQARSLVEQAWEQLAQARENVRLAERLAEAERVQVEAGASDLFRLNLREQQLTLAVLGQIEVTAGYFRALAQYRASLGGALP